MNPYDMMVLKSTGSSKKNSPGETAVKCGDFIAFVSTNWSHWERSMTWDQKTLGM